MGTWSAPASCPPPQCPCRNFAVCRARFVCAAVRPHPLLLLLPLLLVAIRADDFTAKPRLLEPSCFAFTVFLTGSSAVCGLWCLISLSCRCPKFSTERSRARYAPSGTITLSFGTITRQDSECVVTQIDSARTTPEKAAIVPSTNTDPVTIAPAISAKLLLP